MVPWPVGPGNTSKKPVGFYLSDNYQPSADDTGKTAFMMQDNEDFMITSEELENNDTVVRFLSSEKNGGVSIYFAAGDPFPKGFALTGETGTVYGIFSLYDTEAETFSLTLRHGGEEHTFNGLVLNKNVLTAYQDNPELNAGQNNRMRDYVTALGVWTAITMQFGGTDAENEGAPTSSIGNFSYGINRSWFGWVDDVVDGIKGAVEDVIDYGKDIVEFFVGVFIDVYDGIITVGSAIGVTVPAPVAAVIAGAAAVVATVIYIIDTIIEEEESSGRPTVPPEQLNAPYFRFYYVDEWGEEQPVPVTRTDETPLPSQAVHIRPHGLSDKYVSNVRFYFKVLKSQYATQTTDIPTTDYLIESLNPAGNLWYQEVAPGTTEDGINYIDIKKRDGYWAEDMRRSNLIVTVYDSSQGSENKQYYPCFYVNGTEFSGVNEFAINFFDYVASSEEGEVVIPPHTVTEAPLTLVRSRLLPGWLADIINAIKHQTEEILQNIAIPVTQARAMIPVDG
jgi:hypothetical protein